MGGAGGGIKRPRAAKNTRLLQKVCQKFAILQIGNFLAFCNLPFFFVINVTRPREVGVAFLVDCDPRGELKDEIMKRDPARPESLFRVTEDRGASEKAK